MNTANKLGFKIHKLIENIQENLFSNIYNPNNYEELLSLSIEANYSYGVALAHIYLAQYCLMTLQPDSYHQHYDVSKKLAKRNNYFDVLLQCYQIEGKRNSGLCEEMAALSNYLKGLKLATKTKSIKDSMLFYVRIADLFFDCHAYKDSESFLFNAFDLLKENKIDKHEYSKLHILIKLCRISCLQGNLNTALTYWEESQSIQCPVNNIALLLKVEDIRLTLLQNQNTEAKHKCEELVEALKKSEKDNVLLQLVYMNALELTIQMKEEKLATWFIQQIDLLYPKATRKNTILLQNLRVIYMETFKISNAQVYENFYHVTQESEATNRLSKAETYQSLLALYETSKQQNLMMERRSNLRIAIDKDELTQIYNRRYLSKLLSKYLQDDRISSLGCVMIDIDYFKGYNDTYGHPKGDVVIKEVATILNACLPEGAYVARYGGDEFSCLFIDVDVEVIIVFIKQVQKELTQRAIVHCRNISCDFLTLSFGVYHETDLNNCDEFKILNRADLALYQAKQEGRNTYAVYNQRGK